MVWKRDQAGDEHRSPVLKRLQLCDVPFGVRAAFEREMRGRADPCLRGLQMQWNGNRVRTIWNQVHIRPLTETFHEFIVNVLKWTFGEGWYTKQVRSPVDQRHVVTRWIYAWLELAGRAMPRDHVKGQRFGAMPTGDATSLLVLADDLYRLQLKQKLPDRLVHKLRDRKQFQGARYEVAAAAIFVRAGCDVDWIDDDAPGKTCEFTATFPGGLAVAVEAKSRRRPGTLNEPGEPPVDWKADVRNLYKKALQKDSRGHPLVVFIDVNRPPEFGAPAGEKAWQKDVFEMFERLPENASHNPACEALLVLTNFAWHHDGDGIAGPGEYMFALPSWSRRGIADRRVVEKLARQLGEYGATPEDQYPRIRPHVRERVLESRS